MVDLQASIRAFFGEWTRSPAVASPQLPARLPEPVARIAADAVAQLTAYQGPDYAQLYVERLSRFCGRPDVDNALFQEIARLLATRMAYDDPIRLAQIALAEPEIDRVCRLQLDEFVSALPRIVAAPCLYLTARAGWSHRTVTRRFSGASVFGRKRLAAEAALRRWRMISVRYENERKWVERWLHMIARALAKQPTAASEIVRTATMVQGYGEAYRQGLADWHLVIDQLAKPAFDDQLALPDLATAISRARDAATQDPRQVNLRRTIASIRTQAQI